MPPSTLPANSPSTALARAMPRPPVQVAPYVEALGADLAVTFLLTYGGAEMTMSAAPANAVHVALIGTERAAALSAQGHRLQKRIPLANRWLAKMLCWQGASITEISRRLRVTDQTVRRYLRDERVR